MTTCIILPFVVGAAERMAGQYAGIVVLEEESDPEQDIFAEPRCRLQSGTCPPR